MSSKGEQMARETRKPTSGRNGSRTRSGQKRNSRGVYVEGSAVRKLQEDPRRRNYPPGRIPNRRNNDDNEINYLIEPQPETVQRPKLSREAQKNREKAMSMNRAFVLFLAVICAAILFSCIHYFQLKSEITGAIKNVASLEAELAQLKEDNDAYYSQVTSNVDLSTIRKIAIGRLGMKNPDESQVITYETEGNSYVRQYQDIPNEK
jgi:cell division protein FtsL